MIFGQSFQQQLSKLRMFLVGAGAVGCEMLKNWAMTGISYPLDSASSGHTGKVVVTDVDSIEKSNLSRQFLFGDHDINHPKSTTAIKAVNRMYPAFHGLGLEQKVATETEHYFNNEYRYGLYRLR